MMMMQLSKFLQNIAKDEESTCDSDGHQSVFLESDLIKDNENDSDPGGTGQRDGGHGKDEDPRLLWRDFGGDINGPSTGVTNNDSNDSSTNEEEEIVFCHNDDEIETNKPEKESTSGAFDEIQNQSEVGTVPKSSSNLSLKNSSVSISLDEGWKGIIVTVLDESETETESRQTSCDDGVTLNMSSGRSFPSVDAWVSVLSDDEHSSASTVKSRNPKTPVYAALVLDSMLGSDGETEKNNGNTEKENDSLLWTWIGGDNNDSVDKRDNIPPTQEIAFDLGSWEDTEHKRTDDGEDSSVSASSPFDEEKETPESGNDLTDYNDVPSLSLFAASTYSRVFGLDYLDNYRNSDESDTEEYIDWSVDALLSPMRSTIPFGTLEPQSDGASHLPSTTAASSGSGSDYNDDTGEWKCIETWFWILFAVGVILVFCLSIVVFYCGVVEDTQAS